MTESPEELQRRIRTLVASLDDPTTTTESVTYSAWAGGNPTDEIRAVSWDAAAALQDAGSAAIAPLRERIRAPLSLETGRLIMKIFAAANTSDFAAIGAGDREAIRDFVERHEEDADHDVGRVARAASRGFAFDASFLGAVQGGRAPEAAAIAAAVLSDEALSRRAAGAMGLLESSPEAGEALANALVERTTVFADTAAAASLAAVGPVLTPETVQRLVALLADPSPRGELAMLVRAVSRHGAIAASAVPAILVLLAKSNEPLFIRDHELRAELQAALFRLGSITEGARAAIASGYLDVPHELLRILLGAHQDPTSLATAVTPRLRAALRSGDEGRAADAAIRARPFGLLAVSLVPDLLPLIDRRKSGRLLDAVCGVIGGLGEAARPAVGALVSILDDSSKALCAVEALGALGSVARDAEIELAVLLVEVRDRPSWAAFVRAIEQALERIRR